MHNCTGAPPPNFPFPLREHLDGGTSLPFPIHIPSHYTTVLQYMNLLYHIHAQHSHNAVRIPPLLIKTHDALTPENTRPPFTLLTSPTQHHHHIGFALGSFLSCSHPYPCNHCATGAVFFLLATILGPVQLHLSINGMRILLFGLLPSPVTFHH